MSQEDLATELLKATLDCPAPSYSLDEKPQTSILERYQYTGDATNFRLLTRKRSITRSSDGTRNAEDVILELSASFSEITELTGYNISYWQPSEKGYSGSVTVTISCHGETSCFRGTKAQAGELDSLNANSIAIQLCDLNTANNFLAAFNQLQNH